MDNGSVDDTAAVARRLGATVIQEPNPGYGAAVNAGVQACTADHVAVIDGDGSLDPRELTPLLTAVVSATATMAVGRRRPVNKAAWRWHARAGNALASRWLRARTGLRVTDISPVRVCRREDLLALGVEDQRFGYPVELLTRAAKAGWVIREYDVSYRARTVGTRSKVSGSVPGSIRAAIDFARILR